MQDTSHLAAIMDRMDRERQRMNQATSTREREFRAHQVRMAEKELEAEYKFLGMTTTADLPKLTDDELLAELMA